MKVLVTGSAGFIGFHVCKALLAQGKSVVGIDNLNNYYDPALKQGRLEQLLPAANFDFSKLDLTSREEVHHLFSEAKPQIVVHLAAQAGVRYSLEDPFSYVDNNLVAFANVLEGCRHQNVEHLVYASSSSVYGANTKVPFSIDDNVDHPISLYAATKKANELMAHSYSHLYNLPTTGLRFFTVYGPWGRPDMAYFSFTNSILLGKPIKVFNHGKMRRDFTYIDDVVEGIIRVLNHIPQKSSASAPYRLYNIGNHSPVALDEFIETLETCLGKQAEKVFLPMQPGDVIETYADVDSLVADVGFAPNTPLMAGLKKFVDWYRDFYQL